MSSSPSSSSASSAEWERKRRLAEIFGDSLPETTSDEREPADDAGRTGRGDAWLKEQVPPHHGG